MAHRSRSFFCNTLHKVVFVVKNMLRVPREGGQRGYPDSGAAPASTARRASGHVDTPWEDGLSLPSAREPLSYEEVRHELTSRTPPTHSRRDRGSRAGCLS